MKYLLKIMYDGTDYCGFQSQRNGRSVQEVLTAAMSELFGVDCTVTGCSRTDAGVHALGFCAAVSAKAPEDGDRLTIPPSKLPRAADRFLPRDISVRCAACVEDSFHPRYDVVSKEYIYKMSDAAYRDPFTDGKVWRLKKPLPDCGLSRMTEAAAAIPGYRDFSSFMASGSKITDARRTVHRLTVSRGEDGIITLRIAADGFLYNMVRIITGTLIDTAFGTFSPADMEGIIAAADRRAAGKTAPACGLYLNEVTYGVPVNWSEP
ncbi:MAG: tRNA pseudouridine(38-40) synthase TruA [Ruminococcaceae bacterium]|nr:tRNA pseudouridine(38-40) synthase TruA [Oscillospiraceae bacterium]